MHIRLHRNRNGKPILQPPLQRFPFQLRDIAVPDHAVLRDSRHPDDNLRRKTVSLCHPENDIHKPGVIQQIARLLFPGPHISRGGEQCTYCDLFSMFHIEIQREIMLMILPNLIEHGASSHVSRLLPSALHNPRSLHVVEQRVAGSRAQPRGGRHFLLGILSETLSFGLLHRPACPHRAPVLKQKTVNTLFVVPADICGTFHIYGPSFPAKIPNRKHLLL